jgi:hypothetical protein
VAEVKRPDIPGGHVPDLIAFITSRLDEEAALAEAQVCGCLDANHWPPCTPQPWKDRALREVAAKRVIVKHAALLVRVPPNRAVALIAEDMLRHLAATWSDHDQYRPEWAPGVQAPTASAT